ncbi:MAG: MATE family efflux transporter [Clostridia bacterium]|nr:MATE family efflux transporter [Clostridia bacterium]
MIRGNDITGNNTAAADSTAKCALEHDPTREAFLTRPLGGLILRNALPAVASMLFMSFYHMTDAIMVGRSLGPEALASVNILYPIMAFFIGLAAMIGVGGNARVAVLQGAGNSDAARRVLGMVIALGTALGIIGSTVTVIAFSAILTLLGTSGALGELSGQYLITLYPFFTLMILIFILEQTVRNDGRPILATVVMMAMAALNIILDYIFLFPLNMGIAGAALATGLAQSLGALIFLVYFLRKALRKLPGLRIGIPGGGYAAFRMIAFNGSSEFFNSIAAGLTTFLFNRALLGYIGSKGVAAFAMVQYLIMFGSVVFIGMSIGAQPILSYNHGAGLTERVRGTFKRLIAVSTLFGIFFFIILRWQAPAMITLFIPDHPETVVLTLRAAMIVSWVLLIMPVGIISATFFTALEKAGSSLLVALSRGLIFTVIGLTIFPLLWGETGIWITPLFSETAAVFVTVILISRWAGQTERVDIRQITEPLPNTES